MLAGLGEQAFVGLLRGLLDGLGASVGAWGGPMRLVQSAHVRRLQLVRLQLCAFLFLSQCGAGADGGLADQAFSRLRRHADRAALLCRHHLACVQQGFGHVLT